MAEDDAVEAKRGSRGQGYTMAASPKLCSWPSLTEGKAPRAAVMAQGAQCPTSSCAKGKVPCRNGKALLSPHWGPSASLLCCPPFLGNTLEKPMKPKVFWAQKTIYSESNIRTWSPSRVGCCHCLICIISCKRLNNLLILLVDLINHFNGIEWNDKR